MRNSSTLICCFLAFIAIRSIAAFERDFVTLRHLNKWSVLKLSNQSESHDYGNYDLHYKWRYRPFLFKFPHKKKQLTTTTTTTTATAITTTLAMEEIATTTEAAATEMPVVSTLAPIRTTTTTTTRPTIPHHVVHTKKPYKHHLYFGPPVQTNLLLHVPPGATNTPVLKSKGKGFLNLFEVIKFENTKCNVSLGDIRTMEGVCYHESECKSNGGIPAALCAEGVGVCCIFLTSCGDSSNQAVLYFESPNYPNPLREVLICVLIVNLRKNVQQLRLDFIMFELNRPTNGDCIEDQFVVSGHNMNFNVPTLCGINTGQHIYIHVGQSTEQKIYMSIFTKVPNAGRAFNIKITQLDSDMSPDGCLQYYTELSGAVKSFNYDVETLTVENKEATYLNNMNYAVCIQRAKDVCSVSYSIEQLGGDQLDYQIVNKDLDENDVVPDGQAGAGIFNCPDDFIAINQVRLCGERFNDGVENDDFTMHATVKDVAAGPIILPFRSNSEYVGRGFRLHYKQLSCVEN